MSISTVAGLCTVICLILVLIIIIKKFSVNEYKFLVHLFILSIIILIVPFLLNQFFYKFNVYAPYVHIREYLFVDYIVIWGLNILFILTSDVNKIILEYLIIC